VAIRGTKTRNRRRKVPIVTTWALELLQFVLSHAQGVDGALFTPWSRVRHEIAEACVRAGIGHCSPNDLRRTCATFLRAEGVPADLVGAVLGHADSRMVERVYGRLSPEVLRARLFATIRPESHPADCSTGATEPTEKKAPSAFSALDADAKLLISVPRDGIEPPARGFSSLADATPRDPSDDVEAPRRRRRAAAPVQQPEMEWVTLGITQPRTRRRWKT